MSPHAILNSTNEVESFTQKFYKNFCFLLSSTMDQLVSTSDKRSHSENTTLLCVDIYQILIYDTLLDVEDSSSVRSKVEVTGDDESMNVFLE